MAIMNLNVPGNAGRKSNKNNGSEWWQKTRGRTPRAEDNQLLHKSGSPEQSRRCGVSRRTLIRPAKKPVQTLVIQNQSDQPGEKSPSSDIRSMLMRPIEMILSFFLTSSGLSVHAQPGMFTGKDGMIQFTSDAPLEMIKAESNQLSGAINPETNGVAFSVRISSFHGFNSTVQREHFMENYLEVSKYPVATLTGKIIEKTDFTKPGLYEVRVKGILNIHGVSIERIIPGNLIVNSETIIIRATFSVPLKEHSINVPKLLSQKIAETIFVQIDLSLQKVQ